MTTEIWTEITSGGSSAIAVAGAPRVMTASGNILRTDNIIHFDRTLGNIAANLPNNSTSIIGQPLYLKVTQDGQGETKSVTVSAANGVLIDGLSSLTLTMENETTLLLFNGTGWDSY